MKYLEAETDEQMLALCESLLQVHTVTRCRRAFMHDIRNPAQSIQSGIELLERVLTSKTSKVSAEQCITLIRQSLVSLQRTIEKTMDGIAPVYGSSIDINAKALVNELAQLLVNDAAARSVAIKVDIAGDASLYGTAARVRQLILSLLLDAIDAVDAGGTVTVSATVDPRSCILVIHDTRPLKPLATARAEFDSEQSAKPILRGEQWWYAMRALSVAEEGTLEREWRDGQYTVCLAIPSPAMSAAT